MKLLITLIILCIALHQLAGQSQFQLTIGGVNNEFAYSMVQTSDGGYALAGYSSSFGAGGSDAYFVKLNASGSILWTRTIGGAAEDNIRSIIQTNDGGYAAAGYTYSFGASSADIFFVKLDASGSVQWTKTVGGTDMDVAYSILQTADGGYLAAGYTLSYGAGSYDAYVVKLDAAGEYQWSKTYGTFKGELGTSLIKTSDGGFAFCGYCGTDLTNSIDYYIVKIDSSGSPLWSTTAGGTAHDYAWGITQTLDGGYAVTGYCQGFGAGSADMYVVKVNASGSVQWTRTIGGAGSEMSWSIMQISDGSLLVSGSTTSFGSGGADVYLVKLSSSGSLQWSRTAGGTINDIAQTIITTSDGGYAAAGTTYTISGGWYSQAEMYVVKIDANWRSCGNYRTQKSLSGTGGTIGSQNVEINSPSPLVTSPIPAYSSGGTVTMNCSHSNSPFVKNESEESSLQPLQFKLEQNYPNPFNPKSNIKYQIPKMSKVRLSVFDVLGHEISELVNREQEAGSYEVSWDASNFPSGVYIYKITTSEYSDTKRMVLIK